MGCGVWGVGKGIMEGAIAPLLYSSTPMPTVNQRQNDLLASPKCWQAATWDDYVALRDDGAIARLRLFFNEGWLWFEMGNEGMNHASISDLLIMLILCWKQRYPSQIITTFSRCQLEQVGKKACAPDLVLYVGEGFPVWQVGQRRFINLDQVRVPDLVGEIADTTLATDLDEKKRLYAALQIPEYWVIDVRGQQVLAFQLNAQGIYQECTTARALPGLAIALLEETLERLPSSTNTDAALWFAQQLPPAT